MLKKAEKNKFSKSSLKKLILDLLKDHSGGMKLMELVTIIATLEREAGHNIKGDPIEKLLEIIRSIPTIGILEYSFERTHKYFIYTK